MLGESIARFFLQRRGRKTRKALRKSRFDGLCPRCKQPLTFRKKETRRREGGFHIKGFLFECHGCERSVWKPEWVTPPIVYQEL